MNDTAIVRPRLADLVDLVGVLLFPESLRRLLYDLTDIAAELVDGLLERMGR